MVEWAEKVVGWVLCGYDGGIELAVGKGAAGFCVGTAVELDGGMGPLVGYTYLGTKKREGCRRGSGPGAL